MKKIILTAIATVILCFLTGCKPSPETEAKPDQSVALPDPGELETGMSVEQALRQRRSVRDYLEKPLSLENISLLLWAAQGITSERGFRTTPSAGALYPLTMYLVAGRVEGLEPGIYRYDPFKNKLYLISAGDHREEITQAALWQESLRMGSAILVISAVYEITTQRYGERGIHYVHMEAGHASQNVYLMAEALGLGTVTIGAFHDMRIHEIFSMMENETPLYLMPIGKKK